MCVFTSRCYIYFCHHISDPSYPIYLPLSTSPLPSRAFPGDLRIQDTRSWGKGEGPTRSGRSFQENPSDLHHPPPHGRRG